MSGIARKIRTGLLVLILLCVLGAGGYYGADMWKEYSREQNTLAKKQEKERHQVIEKLATDLQYTARNNREPLVITTKDDDVALLDGETIRDRPINSEDIKDLHKYYHLSETNPCTEKPDLVICITDPFDDGDTETHHALTIVPLDR